MQIQMKEDSRVEYKLDLAIEVKNCSSESNQILFQPART